MKRALQFVRVCDCGCGRPTALSTRDGKPNRFVLNHHPSHRSPEARFKARVGAATSAGCWPWVGRKDTHGYGQFVIDGRSVLVHRFSYEHFVGPIPAQLTIDHLCRNRACVNPAHMEPVTGAENTRRGNATSAINARKTHCIHGHPFDEENTYIAPGNGMRTCRTCKREDNRRRKAKARAKAAT